MHAVNKSKQEVPTDAICCGYFILYRDNNNAVFTGNGFRTDGGGERGAGYRSAHALFAIYGMRPLPWEAVSIDYTQEIDAIENTLLQVVV